MQKIYLIQAHQYPEQLSRLINKLDDSNTFFYIHIDLKTNIKEFEFIKKENIYFLEDRFDCIWGDFSQVLVTISMFKLVVDHNYDDNARIILLSGQDYVIKSKDYINNFLEENVDVNFINVVSLSQFSKYQLRSLKAIKVNLSSKRADFVMISIYHYKNIIKNILQRKLGFQELKLLFKSKKMPLEMTPFRGSNWVSFNNKTMQKILSFYAKNKYEMDLFFKNTLSADEIFFQTIIMHLKKDDSSIKILPSLTYDNWIRVGVDLPVTFKEEDLNELKQQSYNKLFARKFDEKMDKNILDELDKLY